MNLPEPTPPAPPPAAPLPAAQSPDAPAQRKPWLDWSDRDQRVLVGLALLVFLAIGFHWLRIRAGGGELVEVERLPERQYDFKIDINRATWVEWMQLPGVGEIMARRIVANRAEYGPFDSVADLRRVPGVGAVTFDTIQPWLVCSDCKIGTTH